MSFFNKSSKQDYLSSSNKADKIQSKLDNNFYSDRKEERLQRQVDSLRRKADISYEMAKAEAGSTKHTTNNFDTDITVNKTTKNYGVQVQFGKNDSKKK